MERLADHEAFLQAIFDAPTEDTPRLVYADFLEETGDPERAATLRTAGFGPPWKTMALDIPSLNDPVALRTRLVQSTPEAFAVESVRLHEGRILTAEPLDTLFSLAAFSHLRELHLGGVVEEVPAGPDTEDAGTFSLIDINVTPVITVSGVEALAQHRGARRVRTLILTHNNLDNDAARALARSPYLINLERLDLLEGNRLRGRVWQEVVARFGEAVVG